MSDDQNDHDLLVELRTEMRGMRADIQRYNDVTSKSLGDHEARIRTLENKSNEGRGAERVIQSIIATAISIAIALILKYLP